PSTSAEATSYVPPPSEDGGQQENTDPGYYTENQGYTPAGLPQRADMSANYETSSLDNSPDAEAIRQIQQARSQLIMQAISAKSRVQFDAGTTGGGGSSFGMASSNSSTPIQQLQDVQNQLQGAAALLTGAA